MPSIRTDTPIDLAQFITLEIDGVDVHIVPSVPSWIVTSKEESRFLEKIKNGLSVRDILLDEPREDFETALTTIERLLRKISVNYFYPRSPDRSLWAERKLGVYITDSCNYHCKHCYLDSNNKGNTLPTGVVLRILKQASEYGVTEVTFLGAEPTLHPDFFDILRAAKKQGFRTVVLTNGSTIKDAGSARILADNADLIQVSIDGATKEIADFIRDPGAYENALQAVNLLAEAGGNIEIASILFKENETDFSEHVNKLLNSISSKNVKVVPEMGFELRDKKNLSTCSEGVVDRIKLSIESQGFVTDHSDAFNFKKINCGYGEDILIQANGDVSCCVELAATTIANIYEHSFSECIRRLDKERDKMHVDRIPFCKNCELRYICGGACRVAERERFENLEDPIVKCNLKEDILRKMIQFSVRQEGTER